MLNTVLLAMIGGPEIAIIVLALLLLFGGKKIPELMRGLGRGVREFKEGQAGTAKDDAKEEQQ
ncbi:twin-arginine translocase TatA/TatE family subunit [Olivibacter sp. SDN3]|uniref:twin-arginine translocase TatA/TatE family subunit n=1 Tax=Olivibacter sp. SDN3 TaxID=2764720 RepID=UPI0016512D5B|nr:twin-arginine translocase TatA/TatE family subunit [Olivibacter sp. SDN3]QNL50891.1 twin-arginine translocase TatA/TatE family subunit [Olivibacter sp. SDN3]